MRVRRVLSFILLAAALLGAGAWGALLLSRHPQASLPDSDFTRHRLAFLEAENDRLRAALLTRQHSDDAAFERAARTEIERKVAQLRSLSFLQPVVYKEIPRSDLPKLLSQKLAQQVPDQEFTADGVSLAALGLLPPGIDLKKTYLDLLGEQIGAFYDQHTQELFTFSGRSLANAQNRVILAHELTHALEDQHFSLARLPLETKGNDDRELAATALVEGDATLVMNQYMTGAMSPDMLRDTFASAFTTDVRQLAAAPRFLRETLLFPYLRGQEFCQTLYAHGGWADLAEAFAHPPASTAEILHPERFLTQPRIAPISLTFPDTTVLGEKPLSDNVLGEFGLRQLFARWLPDDAAANAAAAGWRGDRYLVYGEAKSAGYVLRVACADEAGAAVLGAACRHALTARYRLGAPAAVTRGSGKILATQAGSRQLQIWVVASDVIVIDAPNARWGQALQAQFGPK